MKKELQEALEKISKLEELLKQKDERIVFLENQRPFSYISNWFRRKWPLWKSYSFDGAIFDFFYKKLSKNKIIRRGTRSTSNNL